MAKDAILDVRETEREAKEIKLRADEEYSKILSTAKSDSKEEKEKLLLSAKENLKTRLNQINMLAEKMIERSDEDAANDAKKAGLVIEKRYDRAANRIVAEIFRKYS